jgi:hypothetical protein
LSAEDKRPPLDPELAAFIGGGVSIAVATRDAGCTPHLVRGVGCHYDGRRVVVLVPVRQAGSVVADVKANGMVAVVFSRPSTHRTVQLKGDDASVAPAGSGDAACAPDYRRAFVEELQQLGWAPEFTEALLEGSAEELAAIAFTPAAAYSGTPGPLAGQRLGAGQ